MFDEYSQRGLRYALAMLRNLPDAEEVVQEAFYRLLKSRHRTASAQDFAAVFFTTLRNLCVDVIRQRQRHPTKPLMDASDQAADTRESGELVQLQRAIREAMDNLPEPWAEALRLRIDGDLSYDKIAIVLKCTKAQVRTWIYRGRRQLERDLDKQQLLDSDHPLRANR